MEAAGSVTRDRYHPAVECRFINGHKWIRICLFGEIYICSDEFIEISASDCEQAVNARCRVFSSSIQLRDVLRSQVILKQKN